MSFADYQNRLVDISLLTGPTFSTSSLEPGPSGLVVTGILKLCQRVVMLLFTTRGSITGLPDIGCDFIPLLRSGILRTDLDVQAAFDAAAADLKLQLQSEYTDDTPADERLASVTVQSVIVNSGSRSVAIRAVVDSEAGTSRELIMPITNLLGN